VTIDAPHPKGQPSEPENPPLSEKDQPHIAEELLTSGYGFFVSSSQLELGASGH
jgi:hypothetical protein